MQRPAFSYTAGGNDCVAPMENSAVVPVTIGFNHSIPRCICQGTENRLILTQFRITLLFLTAKKQKEPTAHGCTKEHYSM